MADSDLTRTLAVSAAAMQAQSTRLRVIAENLANQDTTGSGPNVSPYRRKTVTFSNEIDRASGQRLVHVRKIAQDKSEFPLRYDPSHPAADAKGYVRVPNVNTFVEVMDMREAQRTYSANLSVMQVSRGLLSRAIDMLK